MDTVRLLLTVFHILICVGLMVIVLMQQGKGGGLNADFSGGSSDTFFGKNKGRTFDAFLRKITTACAVIFILTSLCLTVFFTA